MEIYSVGSSSSGNSYIIKTGSMNLILDVGLSATRIIEAMERCGLQPEDVDAVLITHEHIDHVRSVRAISRKCPNAVFFASRGTVAGCSGFGYVDDERIQPVVAGDVFEIGTTVIRCFELSHDANEPIGYSVIDDCEQLTVVTDTGTITRSIYDEMRTADILVFEANHEESILMYGEYPYNVKMRIKSDVGHLSNVCAGEMLARLISEREKEEQLIVMLAHLSEKNNSPYQARITIEDILRDNGYEQGEHYYMCIAAKEGLCSPR